MIETGQLVSPAEDFCVLQGIHFSVVVTEGRPDETGLTMARALDDMGVPVDIILDSAIAYALERFRQATRR